MGHFPRLISHFTCFIISHQTQTLDITMAAEMEKTVLKMADQSQKYSRVISLSKLTLIQNMRGKKLTDFWQLFQWNFFANLKLHHTMNILQKALYNKDVFPNSTARLNQYQHNQTSISESKAGGIRTPFNTLLPYRKVLEVHASCPTSLHKQTLV